MDVTRGGIGRDVPTEPERLEVRTRAAVGKPGDTQTPLDETRSFDKLLAARGLNGAISGMN